jgi:putative transposase
VLELISAILAAVQVLFRSRRDAAIEILALRQQLAVFKRKHPRPKLSSVDRLFWNILRRIWSGWAEALIIVKPDTVVRWHRMDFGSTGDGVRVQARAVGRRLPPRFAL